MSMLFSKEDPKPGGLDKMSIANLISTPDETSDKIPTEEPSPQQTEPPKKRRKGNKAPAMSPNKSSKPADVDKKPQKQTPKQSPKKSEKKTRATKTAETSQRA